MADTVIKINPALDRLVAEIKCVVYEHKGVITLAEAIGAIELAKLQLLKEQS